ncbi:MAG TPA: DUF3857 domain-containing protein, partial [bacterium]|nr:DUF3857 domain-containing protein [bacterium]
QISYRKGDITFTEKRLYKIVKVDGLAYGSLDLDISKDTDIDDLEGYRLDESGKLLETLEKENIKRTGYSDHFFDDHEQFSASFKGLETGDFVAFEYELEDELFFKQQMIAMGASIEIAEKRVTVPEGVRCAVLNDPEGAVSVSGNVYTVKSRPALKAEDNGPALRERIPFLGILFEGSTEPTWESHSRMVWEMTREIPVLSDATRQELQALPAVQNREEFIRRTLKHVSENVRYVAIEDGEGRFIPRDVNLVHQRQYGDCKDMAYYAVAILRTGGVTAHPVLALTRRAGPVFEEFPMHQFNHVIVAVELDGETMGLKNFEIGGKPVLIADLTDKYTAVPMIGDHLEDTSILPVMETGAPLLKIPAAPPVESSRNYVLDITFGADRSIAVKLTETKRGHAAAAEKSFRENMKQKDENEIYRDWIHDMVPGAEMKDVTVEMDAREVRTEVTFTAGNLGTDVNDIIYFIPNLVDARKKGYTQRTRESDMVLSHRSVKEVRVNVTVDPTFRIQKIPEAGIVESDFFTGSLDARQNGQTVSYDVRFEWKVNRIPADAYPDFRKEYRKYLKVAKAPIQLKPV